MPVQLNHTIVNVRDKKESASFVAEILGLARTDSPTARSSWSTSTTTSLSTSSTSTSCTRSTTRSWSARTSSTRSWPASSTRGLTYWADPLKTRPGEFNTDDGGRGLYWEEPSGHLLEIITRPYGSGDA